ncbi:RidA family protein [Jeotgalibacillus sp. R-1-5s-1]|uniref:RidA family protein n=1 Tax=Jeotgalibacillus sp. R-1-5s-1 TaxID=2555897 RepID=UPI00106AE65C|nr:Rid family hydrolase [Jeotgalibacillus sp. R-1-5s-1]TFD99507.1 RidA family protein [Jeotgalibacillus sp. R-1-5s-1]
MKISRNPDTIHHPVAPYVHQIEVTGPHKWLSLSGQLGMTIDGTIPEDPLKQLQLALENVKKNLDAADMEIQDLMKMVFYLVGEFDAEQRRSIIGHFLGDHLPCTTLIYVVALAAPAFKVEVDAWACKRL